MPSQQKVAAVCRSSVQGAGGDINTTGCVMASRLIDSQTRAHLSLRRIVHTWWPLTASWMMMTIEGPLIVAMVARLPASAINLAALGGIVRALTFAIESPILMLLSASAALSKDWDAYRRLRTYTVWGILILTAVHAIIAFTPVYYLVTRGLIGAPAEIIEPGRIGMMITVPYLAAVAYRRFNQGVLIRFGHSRAVAAGTGLRLVTVLAIMAGGLLLHSASGVIVAALTMTVGVTVEASYIERRVRPVLRTQVKGAAVLAPDLTVQRFLKFYIPLAMTSVAMYLMQPVVSAALSRMPDALISLAVWPPVMGIAMLLASGGMAMVEVVVTLLDQPRTFASLRRFTVLLMGVTALLAVALAATPLGAFWFGRVSALREPILDVARHAFWVALLYPIALVIQGLYQGVLTHAHHTRRITEAVFLNLLVSLTILSLGVVSGRLTGIYVGVGATVVATVVQGIWLRLRSRPVLRRETSTLSPPLLDEPA
ncbi:MAG TPA: hypothetical protein DEP84_35095 [Chloroflexi bacterium]|nr:hypothetical protein [Chloroflexota bacterium]